MKKQINPTIKAHLIRGTFYLLLLLAVCAIPFALAQSRSRGTTKKSATQPAMKPDSTTPNFGPRSFRTRGPRPPTSADSILAHPESQAKETQPSFAPQAQLVPLGVDCNDPSIIRHDDGTIENGGSGNPLAGVTEVRFADKFTPTSYPNSYTSVCLDFVTLAGGPPTYNVDIVVYDDDGAGGSLAHCSAH